MRDGDEGIGSERVGRGGGRGEEGRGGGMRRAAEGAEKSGEGRPS